MLDNILAFVVFNVFVVIMLVLDLYIFHGKNHEDNLKQAFLWSGFWIALSLIFNAGIYYFYGCDKAIEFLTGYLIEKSLSVDNLFVFLMIFSYFGVKPKISIKSSLPEYWALSSCGHYLYSSESR